MNKKRIFYLEDHEYFATEIIEALCELGHEVFYASSYKEAEAIVGEQGPFDFALLDVMLQNGKTGFLFAANYEKYFGECMFITGCTDASTLNNLSKYKHVNKLEYIWADLADFLGIEELRYVGME